MREAYAARFNYGPIREPPGTVPLCGVRGTKGDCPPLRRRFSDRLYDLRAVFADLKRQERESGRKFTAYEPKRLPPRRPEPE